MIATLWWLFFFCTLGLCIGSFLNVVIYRIPRDKSLRVPLWSACPYCSHRIRWYDNLPVISLLALGCRCRDCKVPISLRYMVIEIAMAIIVVLLLDAFFVGQVREGIIHSQFGLTDGLTLDWPIFIAHIILFAALLSMSAIDLEHYWVDVRFTTIATVCGFALHTLWTPRHSTPLAWQSEGWFRPHDVVSVVSLFALLGLGLVYVLVECTWRTDPEDYGEEEMEDEYDFLFNSVAEDAAPPTRVTGLFGGLFTLLVLVGLLTVISLVAGEALDCPHWLRALPPIVLFFLMLIRGNVVSRESDEQIMETIDSESSSARQMALIESALLAPAILLAIVGLALYFGSGDFASRASGVIHTEVGIHRVDMMRSWQPIYGFTTAASGFLIAGALGWAVRIVFTLFFGREAFGVGDIHLMAAAGCIAGWPVVVLGFFLTCGLALLGWVICLPFKQTKAIPLGPWLSLSFLIVVVFYESIVKLPTIERFISATKMIVFGSSQV